MFTHITRIFDDEDFILGMQKGFKDCAEWSDNPKDYDEETPYEEGNGFSDDAIKLADEFVLDFFNNNKDLLREVQEELHPDEIGHNLWLTIQGHGTGFWDRGLGKAGNKLTEICEKLGGFDVYANDDGLLEL